MPGVIWSYIGEGDTLFKLSIMSPIINATLSLSVRTSQQLFEIIIGGAITLSQLRQYMWAYTTCVTTVSEKQSGKLALLLPTSTPEINHCGRPSLLVSSVGRSR